MTIEDADTDKETVEGNGQVNTLNASNDDDHYINGFAK